MVMVPSIQSMWLDRHARVATHHGQRGLSMATFWAGSAPGTEERFHNLRVVGNGGFSVVASAIERRTGRQVAIKRIGHTVQDAQACTAVVREIRLLSMLRHPNIVAFHGLLPPDDVQTFNTVFIVEDYMASDVRQLIKQRSRKTLDTSKVATLSYMAQILAGLEYIHALGAIHRDIKPENLLLSSQSSQRTPYGLICLADFGQARVAPRASMRRLSRGAMIPKLRRQMTTHVATRIYRAPEVMLEPHYTNKIDIWAVGCTFKELLDLSEVGPQGITNAKRTNGSFLFPGHRSSLSPESEGIHLQLDQVDVIFRTLGTPTASEFAHASESTQDLVRHKCPGGKWSTMSDEMRAQTIRLKLGAAVPSATSEAVELLAGMVALSPVQRLSASLALSSAYFEQLPLEQRPLAMKVPGTSEVKVAFSFENEELDAEELREILQHDMQRFAVTGDEKQGPGEALTMADLTGDGLSFTGSFTESFTGSFTAHQQGNAPGLLESALSECLRSVPCLPQHHVSESMEQSVGRTSPLVLLSA